LHRRLKKKAKVEWGRGEKIIFLRGRGKRTRNSQVKKISEGGEGKIDVILTGKRRAIVN